MTTHPSHSSETCQIPPSGWRCTRPAGHEGPCAAWPDDNDRHPFSEAQLERVARGVMSIQEGEAFCNAVRDLCSARLRLREFALWVAGHELGKGTYADDDHPYTEWRAPDGSEMDFGDVAERAREALL